MKEKLTTIFSKIKCIFVAHKAVSVAVSCAAALVICTGAVTAVLLNRPADSLVDTSTSLSESDKELTVDESELDSALSVEEGTEVSTITNESGGTTEVASNSAESISSVSTPSVSTPQSSTSTSTAAPSTTTSSTTPSTSTPSTPESSQPTTQEPTPTPTPEPAPEPEPEYPPFDANTVINNAIPRIKEFMIYMPEYAQELIQKGELTQEEYDKWGPSGGMGYFTFTFRLDETMEEIEQGLVDLYRQEHELYGNDYFYIEYAGVMHDGETYKGVTYIGSRPGHWFFLYRG